MARVILGILLALLGSVGAWAQSPADSWDNLKQLQVGQKIEVVDMNLKSLKGMFAGFSEQAILIRTDEGEKAIERASVFRVSTRGGKRARNALLGLAIGAATGMTVGAAATKHDDEEIVRFLKLGLSPAIGAGVGAGVGAAFPGSRTIYRAPRREPTSVR